MKINVVTLCSGYDSQCLALDELKKEYPDLDYDLVAWSEFDPESNKPLDEQPAVVAHNLLFPQFKERNLGDMTKIDWQSWQDAHPDIHVDLLVYSTPCQSISNAGLQHGIEEGSGTRSSILWNTIDAVKVLRPRFLLQENVKNLVSKKFMPDFRKWCDRLEENGYVQTWTVMNAKNYGIPQNRERVFMISVRNDINLHYEFPKPFPLTKVLADILEQDVEENYFLSDESVEKFLYNSQEFKDKHNFYTKQEDVYEWMKNGECPSDFFDIDENGLPKVVLAPSGNFYHLTYEDGEFGKHPLWVRTSVDEDGKEHKWAIRFRIRKLTPRCCFRLMGVPDDRIDQLLTCELVPIKKGSEEMKYKPILSNSALYKLAGNSIVVDCLKYIFRNLFYPDYDTESLTDKNGQGLLEFEF